ncbi:MAG: NADH-quinone oxidoreductase subunit N [Chloroflexota bacterium]
MDDFNFIASLASINVEIGLTIMAIVVLFLDVYLPESKRRNIAYVSFFGLIALSVLPLISQPDNELYWGGMIRHDVLAQIFKVMITAAGAITCLIAIDTKDLGNRGEFYLIVIVSTLGACLVSAASDLIMVYIALETISIPLYILATFKRDDMRSAESGMKYFLFGSFASAIMLYGLSLLYGFTGQTGLSEIAAILPVAFEETAVPVLGAMVMIVVGFGFKISAAPFHFWTPDVYEGAPTPVTAFVSVASKAASFALLVRFFVIAFPVEAIVGGEELQVFWVPLMSVLATVTMTLGNVLALSQKNIKRLLAYSSVAQAGYTLIGVAALQNETEIAVASIGFYMFMYTFTNLLAFAVVILFSEGNDSEQIADFAGLANRNRWLALTLTIAFLSLAGLPPAAGFVGKFFLFNAAVQSGLTWLAVVGIINSLIAVYYYLVVVKVIYFDDAAESVKPVPVSMPYAWMLGLNTIIIILLGTALAQPVYNWAQLAAEALFA